MWKCNQNGDIELTKPALFSAVTRKEETVTRIRSFWRDLQGTLDKSWKVKSMEKYPWVETPLTAYVLEAFGKACLITDEFCKSSEGKQIPTASFVNWTSHHNTKSGTLTALANWYAFKLESGNNPENPPLAITNGGNPATFFGH